MLMFALLALVATPAGEIKIFGDWAVGCDNGARCQMVSLSSEDDTIEQDGEQLVLTREAGPAGGVDITIPVDAKFAAPVSVAVDDKVYATLALPKPGNFLHIDGMRAEALARAMASGSAFAVAGEGGDPLGVSLKGAAAAMRYIDAAQGRGGTVTALVAKGPKTASAVPPPRALPHIVAIRPPAGPRVSFGQAMRLAIGRAAQCDDHLPPMIDQIDASRLDARTMLALIPCGSGAYNFIYEAVLVIGGKAFSADFEIPPALAGTSDSAGSLLNASFDPTTGILNSHDKSRGPGDCGSDEDYVWDGKRFRLAEASRMDECRGSIDWITVWRSNVTN